MGKHKEKHKQKKNKKERKKKHQPKRSRSPSDSSSSSEEVWVEKEARSSSNVESSKSVASAKQDDEWLSFSTNITSTSNVERRKEREEARTSLKEQSQYNPRSSVRELNPYWKDGGDGLPTHSQFKKPEESDQYKGNKLHASSSNWRKKIPSSETTHQVDGHDVDQTDALTSNELNALAAKLVKAEIMGNKTLAAQLKEQLDKARNAGKRDDTEVEDVILTTTDARGYSKPVEVRARYENNSQRKGKKRKVETHSDGQRIRYFADDDKYSLKQMFEREKYHSTADQDRQFLKMAGRIRKNDDLDDVFTDDIRQADETADQKDRDRAVREHLKVTRSLDGCRRCLQSESMQKHLMVTMRDSVYLSLPHYEPLTEGHCLLIPVRHVPCATQLDENEWVELLEYAKALCAMFDGRDKSVLFFETAMFLHAFPHMVVECVPLPKERAALASMYFKKAIDESETEWASNKKLIPSVGPDIRRIIPKGLTYFSVSFGMNAGFAHVVEDEKRFPRNFAQEVIGGMLDLHHGKWRKPKPESFAVQSERVVSFSKMWSHFEPGGGL